MPVADLSRRLAWSPPRLPQAWRGRVVEVERLEWRRGDGGDPAALLEDYLTGAGLPVRDLARSDPSRAVRPGAVCGAAVMLGAEACAAGSADARDLSAGAASPVPEVPDLVAVLLSRTDAQPPDPAPVHGGGAWRLGRWADSWTPREHAVAVEEVREAIARGDVYQVDLVGHASAAAEGDPGPALARVAELPGASYGGTLLGDGWGIATASMECMLRVQAGRAVTVPVKGTARVRGTGDRGDALRASLKDRAEHVMVVDLERHDLARVAVTGGVSVDELYAVTRWADLWHAGSTVGARLRPGAGLAELLRATLPGGSVTGAPKRAALEQLTAREPVGRGPSMGAFGTVTPRTIDLGLSIRTVAAAAGRVHLWTGGGITWSSSAADEVAEARAKAEPIRRILTSEGG